MSGPRTEAPHTALAAAPRRRLGPFEVAPVGLGCMNLSHVYHPIPSKEQAARVIDAAFELGIDHFDTAALYGFGANEELLGELLGSRRDEIILASKCGMTGVDGKRVIDGRPETLRATAQEALQRLRTEVLDLYYLHRVDPAVPVEESIGALAELVGEGLIRSIGLSEVSADTVRRAHTVHPIAAVQNEYSLWTRNPEIAVLDACRELGVTLVAFSPLARGVLTSSPPVLADLPAQDLRHGMPRFQGDAYAANLVIRHELAALAEEAGCTLAQLSVAWLLAQDPLVVPIPGTRSPEHLAEDVGGATVEIAPEVLTRAGELLNEGTVRGARYGPEAARDIDSEAFADAG